MKIALFSILIFASCQVSSQATRLSAEHHRAIETQINSWRKSKGLTSVMWTQELSSVADSCAKTMAAAGTLGVAGKHSTRFEKFNRLAAPIFQNKGKYLLKSFENLCAIGEYADTMEAKEVAQAVVLRWENSTGHRTIMQQNESGVTYYGIITSQFIPAMGAYGVILNLYAVSNN